MEAFQFIWPLLRWGFNVKANETPAGLDLDLIRVVTKIGILTKSRTLPPANFGPSASASAGSSADVAIQGASAALRRKGVLVLGVILPKNRRASASASASEALPRASARTVGSTFRMSLPADLRRNLHTKFTYLSNFPVPPIC